MTDTLSRSAIVNQWYSALAAAGPPPPVAAAPPAPAKASPTADEPFEPQPYHADPDETVQCPKCQKMNDVDASYCDQCGTKLAGDPDVKIIAPAAPPAPATSTIRGVAYASNGYAIPPPPEPAAAPAPPPATKAPTTDVDNSVPCANTQSDGTPCNHLASAHDDTATGANTGPCSMQNCDCAGMMIPDQDEDLEAPEPAAVPAGAASAETSEWEVRSTEARGRGTVPPNLARLLDRATEGNRSAPLTAAAPPVAPAPEAAPSAPALPGPADLPPLDALGPAFSIPVAVTEGTLTDDGRTIAPNALTWRDPPIPLMYLKHTPEMGGHGGAKLVGRINTITRGGTVISMEGNFLTTPDGAEAAADLGGMGRLGISIDVGNVSEDIELPPIEGDEEFDGPVASDPVASLTAGVIMAACYSEDTEVLTDSGWKRFIDLVKGVDQVASRNQKTGAFEWAHPTAYFALDYTGPMVHFYGGRRRNLDLLVTPNHRMLVRSQKTGKETFVRADHLASSTSLYWGIPTTSVPNDVDVDTFRIEGARRGVPHVLTIKGDTFAAFMGAWLAEGSIVAGRGRVYISQIPSGRGREAYRTMLTDLLGHEPSSDATGLYFQNRVLADYLARFGHAADKFIPDELKDFSARQLRIFWDHYMLGDGCASRPESVTASERLANDLQEIAQRMGMWATIIPRDPKGDSVLSDGRIILEANKRRQFVVGFRNTGDAGRHSSEAIWVRQNESVDYDGTVYCVSVPNESLYVRRNGVPAWCGNTMCTQAAFPGAYIVLGDGSAPNAAIPLEQPSAGMGIEGIHVLSGQPCCDDCEETDALVAAGAIAPIRPPTAWFVVDEPTELTPLRVTEAGQVYGHIPWNQCHTGFTDRCVVAPRGGAFGYDRFCSGYVLTDEGDEIRTGPITSGTTHGDDARDWNDWSIERTKRHYADTGHAVADVVVRDGKLGIWMCGAMRPTATDEDFRTMRASVVSPDWRWEGNHQSMVAALAVNYGGFPTPRIPRMKAVVASGHTKVLVASGVTEQLVLRAEEEQAEPTADQLVWRVMAPIVTSTLRARMNRVRSL